ncbi:hypothetical protein KID93_22420, partial [Escherichia coli]|nr:hypothetical protein [Escherichia coli]
GWMKWAVIQAEQENDMNILKKLMQRLCGCGKYDGREQHPIHFPPECRFFVLKWPPVAVEKLQ